MIENSNIICTREEEKNASIIPFILVLVFIIVTIISLGIMYQMGCYKKGILWWRGEIIKDGPAKVEIDPKELLRIDDLDNEEIDEPKDNNESTNQKEELHDNNHQKDENDHEDPSVKTDI